MSQKLILKSEYEKIKSLKNLDSDDYLKISNKNSLEDIEKRSELTELFSYEDYISKKGIYTIPGDIHNYTCMSRNILIIIIILINIKEI